MSAKGGVAFFASADLGTWNGESSTAEAALVAAEPALGPQLEYTCDVSSQVEQPPPPPGSVTAVTPPRSLFSTPLNWYASRRQESRQGEVPVQYEAPAARELTEAAGGVSPLIGLRIVCISDTHGGHRKLTMPPGDILIHAGDYTYFSKKEDATDFNAWLGELNYKHKIVVQGNHESSADWAGDARAILSNAVYLEQEEITVEGVRIYGAAFFWSYANALTNLSGKYDLVIAHGPAKGYVDGNNYGCPHLANYLKWLKPKVLISGHIHEGRGVVTHDGVTYVNASNAGAGMKHKTAHEPIVLTFE